MKIIGWLLLILLATSCSSKVEEVQTEEDVIADQEDELHEVNNFSDAIQSAYNSIGLVAITSINDQIIIDLKYASTDNFMGSILYDTLNDAFLQKEVALRLSECQNYLDSLHPGYKLKVFDAVRPLQVQREMWDALDTVPLWQRGKFVSNPLMGSVHNFGSAVDITICDPQGNELDMGAGYDDFRPIAFPSKEVHYLATGELSKEAHGNRILLRKVMHSQSFYNIPSEWWHFNAFSRPTSEKKFEILLDESGNHQQWRSPQFKKKDSLDANKEYLEGEELQTEEIGPR